MKKDFVSLAEARPDLAKEWNYEKNGDLKPKDVSCGSNKKVWWKLPYDVPDDYPVEHLRGKHFDFEWESTIAHRNNGRDCPYLNGKAVWPGFNDIATINPELAAQWHPVKNGNLKPTKVTIGSKKKVWWILPYDVPDDYPIEHLRGKHFDFEWKASANERNYNGCPYFSGKATWEGFNDLQTVNPTLAKEWHPTKNRGLKSTQVTVNSNRKVWWLLSYEDHKTGKYFNFEWQATVYSRNQGVGCPYLTIYKGEEYIKQYLEKYNGVKSFMDNIVEQAKEEGYVETLFHRRRYIPELKSNNYMIRQFGSRAAMNTPIQGTAADIMKIAMINVYKNCGVII